MELESYAKNTNNSNNNGQSSAGVSKIGRGNGGMMNQGSTNVGINDEGTLTLAAMKQQYSSNDLLVQMSNNNSKEPLAMSSDEYGMSPMRVT